MTEPAEPHHASDQHEQRAAPRQLCLGFHLLYSPLENQAVAGMGQRLHRAALHDLSVRGLSFDIPSALEAGHKLVLIMPQPQGHTHERLVTEVRWCRPLHNNLYRVGVHIDTSELVEEHDPAQHAATLLALEPLAPSGAEAVCPACGKRAQFEFFANQPLHQPSHAIMPLYNCSDCGTTRSFLSLLNEDKPDHS